jgi:iron(III) transport system substrate-binding protein
MHGCISRRVVVVVSLLAAIVATLVAASVGSSAVQAAAPPIPAKLKADIRTAGKISDPAQRMAALEQLAENEGGELNVYTSLSSLIVKSVQSQWAKDYPKIKLNLFRGSSEDVTARVVAERKAHPSNGADVIETNGTNMLFFQHFRNVLIPYTGSPFRKNVSKAYQFDTFTADRLEKFVVAWNSNLVGSNAPRTWQDLTNTQWKGKLAMEPTDVDWFAALYEYLQAHGNNGKKMTTKQVDALMAGIARNSQLIPGHTAEATALAAGQIAIVVSGHAQSIENLLAKNAPISFGPPFVAPVIERPQGVGITYWAPHPAAALLFYDWLLSNPTQTLMNAGGVTPASTAVAGDSFFSRNPPTIRMDLRPIVAHYAAWQKKFDSFTRLGTGN